MPELSIEEKAKLFNFAIAVKELAKKYGFVEQTGSYWSGIDIDEWEGKITARFMTSECAKREYDKEHEIAPIQEV